MGIYWFLPPRIRMLVKCIAHSTFPINTTYECLIWASQVDVRCCESSWTDTSYVLVLVMLFKLSLFLASFPRSCYWKLYCLLIHHPVLSIPNFFLLYLVFSTASQLLFLCELESAYSWLICYFKAMLHFIIGIQLCIWPSCFIQNSNSQKQLPFVFSNVCLRI